LPSYPWKMTSNSKSKTSEKIQTALDRPPRPSCTSSTVSTSPLGLETFVGPPIGPTPHHHDLFSNPPLALHMSYLGPLEKNPTKEPIRPCLQGHTYCYLNDPKPTQMWPNGTMTVETNFLFAILKFWKKKSSTICFL
jgi:hypothetical protein